MSIYKDNAIVFSNIYAEVSTKINMPGADAMLFKFKVQ
jgi:hypothetical protein